MIGWATKASVVSDAVELPRAQAVGPAVGAPEATGWGERIDELLAVRQLEDDWDGQGTPAPATAVVDSALILALLLRREGIAAPNGVTQGLAGGVHFGLAAGGRPVHRTPGDGPPHRRGLRPHPRRSDQAVHYRRPPRRGNGVTPETDPVAPDEMLVRLVWKSFYKPADRVAVRPSAFTARADETEGISLFRLACLPSAEAALAVMAPEKQGRYAVTLIPAAEVFGLGLTVTPAPIPTVPGHAVIPELNCVTETTDSMRVQNAKLKLAELATANVVRPPTE